MSNYCIVIQNTTRYQKIPSRYYFQRWVKLALAEHCKEGEVTIRLVDETESAKLNQTYRRKTGPTNILSFPFEAPVSTSILGDLVICIPIICKEAKEQNKPLLAHWAHMVIHGVLHLLGYDHIKKKEAKIMEELEISLLKQLGYANPYE